MGTWLSKLRHRGSSAQEGKYTQLVALRVDIPLKPGCYDEHYFESQLLELCGERDEFHLKTWSPEYEHNPSSVRMLTIEFTNRYISEKECEDLLKNNNAHVRKMQSNGSHWEKKYDAENDDDLLYSLRPKLRWAIR